MKTEGPWKKKERKNDSPNLGNIFIKTCLKEKSLAKYTF